MTGNVCARSTCLWYVWQPAVCALSVLESSALLHMVRFKRFTTSSEVGVRDRLQGCRKMNSIRIQITSSSSLPPVLTLLVEGNFQSDTHARTGHVPAGCKLPLTAVGAFRGPWRWGRAPRADGRLASPEL